MYHIVQENCFHEANYDKLILALNRLNLEYEIVRGYPFIDDIEIKTDRTDIFNWGSIKLSKIAKKFNWKHGTFLGKNHDFMVYKNYYKEYLFNYDSTIIKLDDDDDYDYPDGFFARPTKDTKTFTGQVFNKEEFIPFRNRIVDLHEGEDIEIQISGIKSIQKEYRFWIVKGEIITASQYRLGNRTVYDSIVDENAYDFCRKMIKIFEIDDAFVIDICMSEDEYYIMECGCINHMGVYCANMQKLVMSLENAFN
jgi:hypothetical protein